MTFFKLIIVKIKNIYFFKLINRVSIYTGLKLRTQIYVFNYI